MSFSRDMASRKIQPEGRTTWILFGGQRFRECAGDEKHGSSRVDHVKSSKPVVGGVQ